MTKPLLAACAALLLAGCFGHRATVSETADISVSVPAQTEPLTPAATPASSPQTIAATPAVSSPKTTPAPAATPAPATPTVLSNKPATPAPDKPVFKDEPLIDLTDRRLNPLAVLTPAPDTSLVSPWQGEQLKYGLYYSFVKVGTAYIKNRGLVDVNGRQAYVIQTSAFSASVIDSVFKVRDINLSWLDAQNFYSLGYSQSLREGRYRRDEWVLFDYDTNTYRGELAKKSGTREISGTLTTPVLDMLTALYFVRGQDLKNGQDVVFDIINREEQYPLVVKVIGRETVKTAAGKFKCVIVEPQFRGEGIFVSKGKSLQVWLTDDPRRLPIKMKVEVFIGSVSAELLEYQRN